MKNVQAKQALQKEKVYVYPVVKINLQDKRKPDVVNLDIIVRKADLDIDIKILVSYALGCMFGINSLGKEFLAFCWR